VGVSVDEHGLIKVTTAELEYEYTKDSEVTKTITEEEFNENKDLKG